MSPEADAQAFSSVRKLRGGGRTCGGLPRSLAGSLKQISSVWPDLCGTFARGSTLALRTLLTTYGRHSQHALRTTCSWHALRSQHPSRARIFPTNAGEAFSNPAAPMVP